MIRILKSIRPKYIFPLLLCIALLQSNCKNKNQALTTVHNNSSLKDSISNHKQSYAIKIYHTHRYHIINVQFNFPFDDPIDSTRKYFIFSSNIHKSLPEFTFKIFCNHSSVIITNTEYNIYGPIELEIYEDKKSEPFQIIHLSQYDFPGWGDFEKLYDVQLVDMNFDGYLDLRLLEQFTPTGIITYGGFLYYPDSKEFIYYPELSVLVRGLFNYKDKIIISYERAGVEWEFLNQYIMVKNKLILIKEEAAEMYYDKAMLTTKTYKNGRMEVKKQIVPHSSLNSLYYELSDSSSIY